MKGQIASVSAFAMSRLMSTGMVGWKTQRPDADGATFEFPRLDNENVERVRGVLKSPQVNTVIANSDRKTLVTVSRK